MALQVIEKRAENREFDSSLLFIHGAGATAACWDAFQTYFAESGFDTYAVNLRGHGGSPSPGWKMWNGYADYLEDIRSVVEGLETHPILIGHSWGGYLTQKYLERYSDCPGAVLLASPAPEYGWGLTWRMFKMHPILVILGHVTSHPHIVYSGKHSVRDYLFRADTPQELIDSYTKNVQTISSRLYLESIFSPPDARQNKAPLIVIGCEGDALYDASVTRRSAECYLVNPVILPGLCHMMMLDPEWKRAASEMLVWLVDMVSKKGD